MANRVEKIFLDTSFLFAWLNVDDDHHNLAFDLIRSLSGKRVYFFLTDYIIDEILTLVMVSSDKQKAIEVANKIIDFCEKDPHMRLIYIGEEGFLRAIDVFCRFKDKKWSFTDCTSYVVMKNFQISKGASFDKHFRQFGFKVLP